MFRSSIQTLADFSDALKQLPREIFIMPSVLLSGATIGKHTRHVIELYECLIDGYSNGQVSYDRRQRDRRIEEDIDIAIERLTLIQLKIEKLNRDLTVSYDVGESEVFLDSNYFREVMYNLEHTIHHQALIKIAIIQFSDFELPSSFGVAPSTLKYRLQCAQ